jgi:hypothetical protein
MRLQLQTFQPIAASPTDPALRKDLKTLALFVQVFCQHRHPEAEKSPMRLKTHDVAALAGRPIALCENCTRLLAHALTKRSHCTMDPKPMCKHCPNPCYHPNYRAQIQEVMRYSGMKLLFTGRLDYLLHLLF